MLAGLEEVREGADTLTHSLARTHTRAHTPWNLQITYMYHQDLWGKSYCICVLSNEDGTKLQNYHKIIMYSVLYGYIGIFTLGILFLKNHFIICFAKTLCSAELYPITLNVPGLMHIDDTWTYNSKR